MRKTQTKASHPFKWIIALLVFMLALGVTFSDVHGFNFVKGGTPTGPDGTITTQYVYDMTALTPDGHVTNHHSDDPPAVPEPTTLILMATGLAGIYLARRNK